MDLAEQVAAVWARRIWVLGVSLLVAAAVFAWRSTVPEVYEASATLQVEPPSSVTSDVASEVDYYADTVIGLSASRGVVAQALQTVGRDDDPGVVADSITAEGGTEPGFVEVTVEDSSAQSAEMLVEAVVAAVTQRTLSSRAVQRGVLLDALEAVIRERRRAGPRSDVARAALDRVQVSLETALQSTASEGYWRVTLLGSVESSPEPVAPVPARDALLAFLIAAILLAEGIVIRRAWRGALSARDPAGEAGSMLALPAVALTAADGPGALAPLLPELVRATRVTVVEIAARPSTHVATLLAELVQGRGREVLLTALPSSVGDLRRELGMRQRRTGDVDSPGDPATRRDLLPRMAGVRVLAPGRGGEDGPPRPDGTPDSGIDVVIGAISVQSAADQAMAEVDLRAAGAVVLAIDDRITKRQLQRDAAALRGQGLVLIAVVTQTGRSTRGARARARARRGAVVLPAPRNTES